MTIPNGSEGHSQPVSLPQSFLVLVHISSGLSQNDRGESMKNNPYLIEMKEQEKPKKPIPFFEIGVCLFMGYAGISFLLVDAVINDVGMLRGFGALLVGRIPIELWGVIQLITCVLLGVGLIFCKDLARKFGLGLAFLIYLTYAISYISDVRLVGGVYGINSLVCLLSIFYVHETEL